MNSLLIGLGLLCGLLAGVLYLIRFAYRAGRKKGVEDAENRFSERLQEAEEEFAHRLYAGEPNAGFRVRDPEAWDDASKARTSVRLEPSKADTGGTADEDG